MTAIAISAPSPRLSIVDGHATTTSLQVAEYFGKRHDHVLRDIRELIQQIATEGHILNFEETCVPNFGETSIEVIQPNGGIRSAPAYRLTKDGFTLLAMGFTGKKALAFKLSYITAFNQMESQIRAQGAYQGDALLQAADLLNKTANALRRAGVRKDRALAQALDEVHQHTGIRLLASPDTGKARAEEDASRLVRYIKQAKRYTKDSRFGQLCAQGVMPHSKLLKLVAMPASEFAGLIGQAVQDGLIEQVQTGNAATAYVLARQ